MGVITALRLNSRGKQTGVFVDGAFAVTLLTEVVMTAGLEVGQHLSASQLENLNQANSFQKCLAAAEHYLGYRPRSEAEVRQRLRQRGFNGHVVDKVIVALKERKLIDDLAFAIYWKENRLLHKQRSRRLIGVELRQKGVATETVKEVLEDVDDENSAYEAAAKKAAIVANLDHGEFYHRLYSYLQRRGYSPGTVRSVLERVKAERRDGFSDPGE